MAFLPSTSDFPRDPDRMHRQDLNSTYRELRSCYTSCLRSPGQLRRLANKAKTDEEPSGRRRSSQCTVLYQERLDPVMVLPLADPIGDRRGLIGDREALAEALGESFQQGPGQPADGAVQPADRGLIEWEEPRF